MKATRILYEKTQWFLGGRREGHVNLQSKWRPRAFTWENTTISPGLAGVTFKFTVKMKPGAFYMRKHNEFSGVGYKSTVKMKPRRIVREKTQRFLRSWWRTEEGAYINKEQRLMLLLLATTRVYVHRRITQRETCLFLPFSQLWHRIVLYVSPILTFAVATRRSLFPWAVPVITFVFKVLPNRLLRYILDTCPKRSCSKCWAVDGFGTYPWHMHVQTWDYVRVQSARQSPVSVHVQTCDNVHVQSATQWTASVHTWHMSKPVI